MPFHKNEKKKKTKKREWREGVASPLTFNSKIVSSSHHNRKGCESTWRLWVRVTNGAKKRSLGRYKKISLFLLLLYMRTKTSGVYINEISFKNKPKLFIFLSFIPKLLRVWVSYINYHLSVWEIHINSVCNALSL